MLKPPALRFPYIERTHAIEVPCVRNGRPGYRWVPGWRVVYSPARVSMATYYNDARNMLAVAKKKSYDTSTR